MMDNQNQISRREFLFVAAVALLASHFPYARGTPKNSDKNVDWDTVLNNVIGNRNSLIMGFSGDTESYKVGSPEWCMEEAVAECGLLAEGAQIHV